MQDRPTLTRLTPAQVRGARGMLHWSMTDLSEAAGVSISTIKRLEDAGPHMVSDETVLTMRRALERAGIRFLDDAGEGPGMRFKRR